MIVSTQALSSAFDKVARLAINRGVMPIISCVKLSAKNDLLEIHATNLDCHAIAYCECEGNMAPICVSASILGGLIKGGDESVRFSLESNGRLSVESCGVAQLATQDAKDFPAFPSENLKAMGVPVIDLADCIDEVAWAAAKNDVSRPVLNGVSIETTEKSLTAVATNGHTACRTERALICAECAFVLPADSSPRLTEALRGEGSKFLLSSDHAVAESKFLKVAIRLIEGNYFNMNQIITQKKESLGEIQCEPLITALQNAVMISQGESFCPVVLYFSKHGICVEFVGRDNQFKVLVDTKGEGIFSEAKIRVNAEKLSTALRSLKTPTVKAHLGECNALFLVTGDKTAVIQLMSIPKEEK